VSDNTLATIIGAVIILLIVCGKEVRDLIILIGVGIAERRRKRRRLERQAFTRELAQAMGEGLEHGYLHALDAGRLIELERPREYSRPTSTR
jgi:hypothetical protein